MEGKNIQDTCTPCARALIAPAKAQLPGRAQELQGSVFMLRYKGSSIHCIRQQNSPLRARAQTHSSAKEQQKQLEMRRWIGEEERLSPERKLDSQTSKHTGPYTSLTFTRLRG